MGELLAGDQIVSPFSMVADLAEDGRITVARAYLSGANLLAEIALLLGSP